MDVSVRITGFAEAERKLRPAVIDPPVHRFLTRGGLRMEAELKRHARVDTGHGRRSHTHAVERRRAVAGTNLLHMRVMARGRRAGTPMPPKGALLGWMRRHGVPPEREFLLRRAIARRGITGDNYDERAIEAARPGILRDAAALGREIEAAMRAA